MPVQRQTLSSLRAKLVLAAGPEAALHFVYNGIAVDRRSLRPGQDKVRHLDADVVYEIDRDRETEQRLLAQLEQVLGDIPQNDQAWLAFMMNGVAVLRTMGWEISADPRFPYRIAAADNWYADLQTNRRQEWFDCVLASSWTDSTSICCRP